MAPGEDTNQTSEFLRHAEHLLEIQRPGQAIEYLERALSLEPQNAYILCSLSYAFVLLNDAGRAQEYAERATAADPNEEWAYRLLALVHLRKGRETSAYKAATRSVQIDPQNPAALHMLAQCARALERPEESRLLGEILVRQHPTLPDGHRILAEIALQEEDYATASAGYEKVLELDPQDADAMSGLASIRNKHNRFADSASLLRGAVQENPTDESRRQNLHDSMKRFALFGQANERRKSVGALLVGIFVAYIAGAFVIVDWLAESTPARIIYMVGLPLLLVIGLPMLRTRFLKSQSQQLFELHRSMNRQKRRRTMYAMLVAGATAYAIAAVVYRDSGDPMTLAMPLIIAVEIMWIYMAAITLRLMSLWLSDTWIRLTGKDQPNTSHLPILHIVMPVAFVIAATTALVTSSELATMLAIGGFVLSAVLYAKRFPVGVSLVVFGAGNVLLAYDVAARPTDSESPFGELALFVMAIGLTGLLIVLWRRLQRRRQRQRIARLVGLGADGEVTGHPADSA